MWCPLCDNDGGECNGCGGRGTIELTACPQQELDVELVEVLRLAAMYKKGLPPVAGGALDQSRWFVEACEFLWTQQAYLKRKLKIL